MCGAVGENSTENMATGQELLDIMNDSDEVTSKQLFKDKLKSVNLNEYRGGNVLWHVIMTKDETESEDSFLAAMFDSPYGGDIDFLKLSEVGGY